MDNCTCTSRERVYIVYGNDFTIEAHVSVYDKDEGIYKLLDLTGVKECQMRLVGTYRKAIGKDVTVSGSKVTAFFPGGSVGVGTYGVEITFVDSLGKGRIFERNLIGIVSASGEATVDNDIEGEAGEGLNVSVNVLTRTVRIGDVGSVLADYNLLDNRPSIGGVTLEGNKRPSDLGMYSKEEADGKFVTKESAAEADKRVQGMLDGKVDKEPGKGLSANDLTDERAGKVDKLKMDGRANEYLNGAATYSRPVRQGYGVSVADDNTVSVDPQVIARQSDVANVAADLAAQKAKEQGDIDRANAAISKEETDRKAAVAALQSLIDTLNPGYQFMGVATPETNPGTPDQNVFYVASTAGTYSNFGGIILADGEVAFLTYNGTWTKNNSGFASQQSVENVKAIAGQGTHTNFAEYPGWMRDVNGTYQYVSNDSFCVIPVISGLSYEIIKGETNAHVAFLNSFSGVPSSSFDINGTRISLTSAYPTASGTVPDNAKYIYVLRKYAGSYWSLPSIKIGGLEITEPVDVEILNLVKKLTTKQDNLISGTNIKTINGESIVGAGNINTYTQEQQYIDDLSLAKSFFLANNGYSKTNTAWQNGFYNKLNGLYYENANYRALPLIAVSPGEKYEYSGYVRNSESTNVNAAVIFYGKNKTTVISYLQPVGNVNTPPIEITIPENAYYIGVTAAIYLHEFYLIKIGEVKPYNIYKQRIRPNLHSQIPAIAFNIDIGVTETDFTITDQTLELFESYGLKIGICLKCESSIANPNLDFDIWEKYMEWQNRGHDIINHGQRSVTYGPGSTTIPTYADAVASILDCENALQKHGLISNAWCSPQSTFNPDFIPIINSLYAYAFTFNESGKINTRDANPIYLTRTGFDSLSVAQIKSAIDNHVEKDKLLILYFHANNVNNSSYPNLTFANIEEIIQYALVKRQNQLAFVGGSDEAIRSYFDM